MGFTAEETQKYEMQLALILNLCSISFDQRRSLGSQQNKGFVQRAANILRVPREYHNAFLSLGFT